MDQQSNAVNCGPIQSEGGQAWRQSHMRADRGTGADATKRPRDHAAGGSHEDGERRDVCLDTEGQTTVNSLNLFSHALRESHTLQHTFHVLRPPPPHTPPCNKECEWRPTRNKRRRKTCRDQTDVSDPWGELTSWTVLHSKHHRPAGSAASQTDTEGMSGEEEDDARVQQSHLIPPKTTE